MSDLRWCSRGGLLIDGSGDIAVTLSSVEELQSMVATRLKASSRSWKLYSIGANLGSYIGQSTGINSNTELAIQRAVQASLSDLMPAGSFDVQTVTAEEGIKTWFLPSLSPFATFPIHSRPHHPETTNSQLVTNLHRSRHSLRPLSACPGLRTHC